MSNDETVKPDALAGPVTLPQRPKLLIVDDQPLNVQTLYQVFHDHCEVIVATSGARALELAEEQQPDLVLLDVVMPEMDGFEVCRRLKADGSTKEIPILFVTAQDNPEDETRGLELGAVDFITKPINPAVVKARVRTQLTLKAQADFLRSLAFLDGLTGIPNRRHFNQRLESEWRACQRSGRPLSLIMIDVDYFKFYNDHYGHEAGDDCLKAVARALRQLASRGRDLVARFGGEEFVALLPECDLEGAREMAENIRAAIESMAVTHEASHVSGVVTASVGAAVTVPREGNQPRALLAAADQQLYASKRDGRNRVAAQQLEDAPPAA